MAVAYIGSDTLTGIRTPLWRTPLNYQVDGAAVAEVPTGAGKRPYTRAQNRTKGDRGMRRAAILWCGVLLVSACGAAGAKTAGKTALPPHAAAPAAVVKAYLAALNSHDIDTARQLLTVQHAREVKAEQDSWFTNVKSITSVHVEKPFGGGGTQGGYPKRVTIPVSFDLMQHQVESMPNGHTEWSFGMVKKTPSDRWLIANEGMG